MSKPPGVPEPPETQTLLTEKQPVDKLIPFAKEEVALPIISNALVCMPPKKVDVAVVVASKRAAVTVPTTDNLL